MKNYVVYFAWFFTFLLLFLASGCKNGNPVNRNDDLPVNRVTLQNQSEHSGIMVEIAELDTFTITDSLGGFAFSGLPDGRYSLRAKYPYFSMVEDSISIMEGEIEPPIKIELKQLLQFWMEPAETTISLASIESKDPDALTGFRQFALNLTDSTVILYGLHSPGDFRALRPQGFTWPDVQLPDEEVPNFCKGTYGIFREGDLLSGDFFLYPPSDTVSKNIEFGWIVKECFRFGDYLLYSAFTDRGRNPKYFDDRFVFFEENPLPEIYIQMQESLYKKHELFRPATVHIVE